MSFDISFEYLATVVDLKEVDDIRKIIRLEKGSLSSIENQLDRVANRIKQANVDNMKQ